MGKSVSITIIELLTGPLGLPDYVLDFFYESYIPVLERALDETKIRFPERVMVFRAFVGTITKLLYAFLWQEDTFDVQFVYKPIISTIGAFLMPHVNSFANMISGFKHFTPSIQKAKNVYPGDTKCRITGTHSK